MPGADIDIAVHQAHPLGFLGRVVVRVEDDAGMGDVDPMEVRLRPVLTDVTPPNSSS